MGPGGAGRRGRPDTTCRPLTNVDQTPSESGARVRPFEREPERMGGHRTTPRGVLLLLCLCGVAAAFAVPGAASRAKAKPQIVFPILGGGVSYQDDFGDPRGTGTHEGIDILAPRKALALAAEGGTVSFWTTSASAGCMLYLHGDSGTTYYYIHLNNDVGSGNDNKGKCVAGTAYAPGLAEGDRVEAGQPVGFVGDSGDANGLHPHLHFELHPAKAAVDPFRYLKKARHLLFSEPDGKRYSLVLDGTIVEAGDGMLGLHVTSLREWPSHQHQKTIDTLLTLALQPDVLLTAAPSAQQIQASSGVELTPGARVRVWTGPAVASADARAGLAGAIPAARVLVR